MHLFKSISILVNVTFYGLFIGKKEEEILISVAIRCGWGAQQFNFIMIPVVILFIGWLYKSICISIPTSWVFAQVMDFGINCYAIIIILKRFGEYTANKLHEQIDWHHSKYIKQTQIKMWPLNFHYIYQ